MLRSRLFGGSAIYISIQLLSSRWEITSLLSILAFIAYQLDVKRSEEADDVVWWWVLNRIRSLVRVLELNLEVGHRFVLAEVPLEFVVLAVEATVDVASWFGVGMRLTGW